MFKDVVIISKSKLRKMTLESEEKIKSYYEERTKGIVAKYLNLKKDNRLLENKYVKSMEENNILKARLKELEELVAASDDRTIDKYDFLFRECMND